MKTLNKFWYDVLDRSLDSIAVWNLYAPAFQVWDLTLTNHSAKTNDFLAQIAVGSQADQVLLTARHGRDAAAASLRDLYRRACKLICGSLPKGDLAVDDIHVVRRVRSQSFRAVQDKGDKVVVLWKSINEKRAALSPALPPLLVGTTSVQELQSMLGNYAQLLTNVSNKEAPAKQAKNRLKALGATVYSDNLRWYQAWQGQFAKDSEAYAALSQIDTGPSQALPGRAVILTHELLPDQVIKFTFGAARATRFTILHQGPGETELTVYSDDVTTHSFEMGDAALGVHRFQVVPHNSQGSGAPSVVLELEVAQAAAA